ncbi:MAG: rod-binding protein [Planctomycetales bacterium]|nr:rod-binding protein [Planctomycetales bacterium]
MQLSPAIDVSGLLNRSATSAPEKFVQRQEIMEQVGTEFESVFASMLVKNMRESAATGLFEGDGSDTYGAMFDMFMGEQLAQAGGLGIKQMLVARYAEQQPPPDATEVVPTAAPVTPRETES